MVDPNGSDFSINVVKINHDHAPCTRPPLPAFTVSAETVTFKLAENMGNATTLAVWFSNFQNASQGIFVRQQDVHVGADRTFSLHVPVGAMYTVSTILSGPTKGSHGAVPPSTPAFPLPYADDFSEVRDSQEAQYFADQIGAFEVHTDAHGEKVMRQMVPELPIGWSDHGSNGPMTLIGMREWQDVFVQVSFRLSSNITTGNPAGCVATRVDQMWKRGIAFCAYSDGNWTLSVGGPSQSTGQPSSVLRSGVLAGGVPRDVWHTIALTTINGTATGTFGSKSVFRDAAIPTLDTGFAAIGANGWYPLEYARFSVSEAGHWVKPVPKCASAKVGSRLGARACATNGFNVSDEAFTLNADWTLVHDASGLCAQADGSTAGSLVHLATCDATNPLQQFKNDYTNIRNRDMPVFLDGENVATTALTGNLDGAVSIGGHGDWATWAYFPNTHQLRNQYIAQTSLGYPMCLAVMC